MKTHMNKCMKIGVKKLLLEVRENCCEKLPEKIALIFHVSIPYLKIHTKNPCRNPRNVSRASPGKSTLNFTQNPIQKIHAEARTPLGASRGHPGSLPGASWEPPAVTWEPPVIPWLHPKSFLRASWEPPGRLLEPPGSLL